MKLTQGEGESACHVIVAEDVEKETIRVHELKHISNNVKYTNIVIQSKLNLRGITMTISSCNSLFRKIVLNSLRIELAKQYK